MTSIRDLRTSWQGELTVLDADMDIPSEGPATLAYADGEAVAIQIVGYRYEEPPEPELAPEVILRFIDRRNWSRKNSRED